MVKSKMTQEEEEEEEEEEGENVEPTNLIHSSYQAPNPNTWIGIIGMVHGA